MIRRPCASHAGGLDPVSGLAGIPLLLLEIVAALPKARQRRPGRGEASCLGHDELCKARPCFRCSRPRTRACFVSRARPIAAAAGGLSATAAGSAGPLRLPFAAVRCAVTFVLGLPFAI